jgi:hypothetical protein
MPERHEAFAWVSRPGKNSLLSAYCPRMSAAKIFIVNRNQRASKTFSF